VSASSPPATSAAWQALGRDEKQLPLIGSAATSSWATPTRNRRAPPSAPSRCGYDALIHLWRAHGVGLPRQMIPAEFEPALEGGYIVAGSAATVRERLKRDNDMAGINYCICRLASATSHSRNRSARSSCSPAR